MLSVVAEILGWVAVVSNGFCLVVMLYEIIKNWIDGRDK